MPLEFAIFDLDNTLYPHDAGLLTEIGRRIQLWLSEHMGLTEKAAQQMRRDYFRRYGTTLGGLVAEHDTDVHAYLTFVHDIPVETYLRPNPALATMLASLPLRRAIYTNATVEYSQRVLRTLEVTEYFEHIIGIEQVDLRNKPYHDAYERALTLLGARGPACLMVEDSARNLVPAKTLGMTTILVQGNDATGVADDDADDASKASVDFVVDDVLQVGPLVKRLYRDLAR